MGGTRLKKRVRSRRGHRDGMAMDTDALTAGPKPLETLPWRAGGGAGGAGGRGRARAATQTSTCLPSPAPLPGAAYLKHVVNEIDESPEEKGRAIR